MSTTILRKVSSAAYEVSHSRGNAALGNVTLYFVTANSKAAAAGWIFIYDLAAQPIDGTLPDYPPIPIAASPSACSINYMPYGKPIVNGITAVFSSTVATLTAATADIWFDFGFYAGS